MAHDAQRVFCTAVKRRFPAWFAGSLVVDIGALDINGNNRYLFERCLYLGIDLAPGPNVDIACMGHQLALPDASLDVVISTEAFEHDAHWAETIANAIRMLKPGGLLLFTCATTGRPEHGTRRSQPEDAPLLGQQGLWPDYYRNLEEGDIRGAFDLPALFADHAFAVDTAAHDLYFWGIKRGERVPRTDYSFLGADPARLSSQAKLYHTAGASDGFIEERTLVPHQFDDDAGVTAMVWHLPAGTSRVRIDPVNIPAIFALERLVGRGPDGALLFIADAATGFSGLRFDPDSRVMRVGADLVVMAAGSDCRIEFAADHPGFAGVSELTLRARMITRMAPGTAAAADGLGALISAIAADATRIGTADAQVRAAQEALDQAAAARARSDGMAAAAIGEAAMASERAAAANERARLAEAYGREAAGRADQTEVRLRAAEGSAMEAAARAAAAAEALRAAENARAQATAAALHADQRAAMAESHARSAVEQAHAAVTARFAAENRRAEAEAEAARQAAEDARVAGERMLSETARSLETAREQLAASRDLARRAEDARAAAARELEALRAAHAALQADRQRILESRSWRLTWPLRWFIHLFRGPGRHS